MSFLGAPLWGIIWLLFNLVKSHWEFNFSTPGTVGPSDHLPCSHPPSPGRLYGERAPKEARLPEVEAVVQAHFSLLGPSGGARRCPLCWAVGPACQVPRKRGPPVSVPGGGAPCPLSPTWPPRHTGQPGCSLGNWGAV